MKLRRRKRTRSDGGIAEQLRPRPPVEIRTVEAGTALAEEDGKAIKVVPQSEADGLPEKPQGRRRQKFRKATRRKTPEDVSEASPKEEGGAEDGGSGGKAAPRLVIKGPAAVAPVKVAPRRVKPVHGNSETEAHPVADAPPKLAKLGGGKGRGGHVKPDRAAALKGPAEKPVKESKESEWGIKQSGINWRWAALIVFGMTATVLGSLAAIETLNRMRPDEGIQAMPDLGIQTEREEIEDRAGFLSEKPGVLVDEAVALLDRYAHARTAEEALPEIRSSQRAQKEKFMRHWAPWTIPPLLDRRDRINYAVASNQDPPFMTIWGFKKDYSCFQAYFVRENGQLRLDWEATEMFSDIPVGKLPKHSPDHPVLVRCQVREKPFYTVSLPENRYRSYLIENPVTREFVWGYAERDGEADMKLQGALIAGASFQERNEAQRVAVRIQTPGKRETNSQFLITEMLHIEWVLP